MIRQFFDSLDYLFNALIHNPIAALIGSFIGILFPLPATALMALVVLTAIDLFTGRSAAYHRGDLVTSGKTREMSISKLQGYMIFILTAALASHAASSVIMLKGTIGLLSAIEFFSISENLYDMKLIKFNPREIGLFKGLLKIIKRDKK